MKNAKSIHTLAENSKPSGKIRFIHSDNEEHTFSSCVNRLTGSRMSWFDDEAPSIDDTKKWIRSVFRDIKKRANKVIECVGDF